MTKAKKHNSVVINGRVYDAVTGELLKDQQPANHVKTVKKETAKSIDGVRRAFKDLQFAEPIKKQRDYKSEAAHHIHSKQQNSQTLQREILKNPLKEDTHRISGKSSAGTSLNPSKTKVSKFANSKQARQRAERAEQYRLSTAISKFGSESVNRSPVTKPGEPQREQQLAEKQPEKSPQQIKRELITHQMQQAGRQFKLSEVERDQKTRKAKRNLFKRFSKRPKLTTAIATTAAAILLASYITYLNIPNLSMRVAASRAGFDAQLPGYTPAGFAFNGPIAYAPGQITIQYGSNTDGRVYQITQKQTNWDSKSLLDNSVVRDHPIYQTYKERGLTIYVYEGSNAAWVNGGVWYTIEGSSDLNSDQITKIAASL